MATRIILFHRNSHCPRTFNARYLSQQEQRADENEGVIIVSPITFNEGSPSQGDKHAH